jgi:hypothetical protein
MTNGNDLAFGQILNMTSIETSTLTKREYFSAMAMQGILANNSNYNEHGLVGQQSVVYADALIKALNEKP